MSKRNRRKECVVKGNLVLLAAFCRYLVQCRRYSRTLWPLKGCASDYPFAFKTNPFFGVCSCICTRQIHTVQKLARNPLILVNLCAISTTLSVLLCSTFRFISFLLVPFAYFVRCCVYFSWCVLSRASSPYPIWCRQ